MINSANQSGELAEGIRYEWLHDRQIIACRIETSRTTSIDALYDFLLNTIENWSPDKPVLILYEPSDGKTMITPHIRRRMAQLGASHPQRSGRVAVVIANNTALSHAVRLFIMMARGKQARIKRLFTTREEAVRWLLEAVQ